MAKRRPRKEKTDPSVLMFRAAIITAIIVVIAFLFVYVIPPTFTLIREHFQDQAPREDAKQTSPSH